MLNSDKVILDLCGGTGSWSAPYKAAGYDVRVITLPGSDVRLFEYPNTRIYGVLAAPVCTHLSGCGAKYWKAKGDAAILEALAVADACSRIVLFTNPVFWCLENPVGRLYRWYGPPIMRFNPCDYGDPYTKKTCLWGKFNAPEFNRVEPTDGSKMWRKYGGKSERTKMLRSITPAGFAQAFFESNR